MKNPFLLLLFSLFLSCGKDDCTNYVTGIYNGTCTSIIGTFQGVVKFYPTQAGGGELLIEDSISGLSGFTGILSGNCKTIIIASQPVVNINGLSLLVSGALDVNGKTITGTSILNMEQWKRCVLTT
ncbi:MAG TPA: hypothetical protein VFG10_13310 [Saprospiraceae bacterium]|nr:hypothetical protein [Saprospiraceae bacterium]